MVVFVSFNCFQLLRNMDVKTINERITLLQNQRTQAISNVHAIEGAIQDCKFWLEEISKSQTTNNVVKIAKDKK